MILFDYRDKMNYTYYKIMTGEGVAFYGIPPWSNTVNSWKL